MEIESILGICVVINIVYEAVIFLTRCSITAACNLLPSVKDAVNIF